MHLLETYIEKAAKKAAEDERQRKVATIIARALEREGIDGSSLTVEEGPILSGMGDFLGNRFIAIKIVSFPCTKDTRPESWL